MFMQMCLEVLAVVLYFGGTKSIGFSIRGVYVLDSAHKTGIFMFVL